MTFKIGLIGTILTSSFRIRSDELLTRFGHYRKRPAPLNIVCWNKCWSLKYIYPLIRRWSSFSFWPNLWINLVFHPQCRYLDGTFATKPIWGISMTVLSSKLRALTRIITGSNVGDTLAWKFWGKIQIYVLSHIYEILSVKEVRDEHKILMNTERPLIIYL